MADAQPLFDPSREIESLKRQLNSRDGGGTSGGMSDDWKASVDRQLSQLHDDFRRIIGWLIAAIAAPLLAVVGLYVYTGTKFDALDARLRSIEIKAAQTDGKIDLLLQRTSSSDAGTEGVSPR